MRKMRSLKRQATTDMMIDMPPSFSLTETQLPEAKDWQVGKKYTLEVEVEMVGSNINEYSKDKTVSYRFNITKVGAEMDEDELEAKRGNY